MAIFQLKQILKIHLVTHYKCTNLGFQCWWVSNFLANLTKQLPFHDRDIQSTVTSLQFHARRFHTGP